MKILRIGNFRLRNVYIVYMYVYIEILIINWIVYIDFVWEDQDVTCIVAISCVWMHLVTSLHRDIE